MHFAIRTFPSKSADGILPNSGTHFQLDYFSNIPICNVVNMDTFLNNCGNYVHFSSSIPWEESCAFFFPGVFITIC